jgi:hypothetical protein
MKDILGAITEEKEYQEDRLKQINTSLIDRLKPYGYETLNEYFHDKRDYKFKTWIPEVYRIDAEYFAEEVAKAIQNKQYGIYIPIIEGYVAYHGSDVIDRELCKALGVTIVDLHYTGGTIIGSDKDFAFYILIPQELSYLNFIDEFYRIISKYVGNVEVADNDILVNGEKVMGSMERFVDGVIVWASQTSFGEYENLISQNCNKKSSKKPSYINNDALTASKLESEVLSWLLKQ